MIREAWYDAKTIITALFNPRCFRWSWVMWLILGAILSVWIGIASAQVFGSKVTNAGGITCPASGSSIQVLAPNGSRQSYAVLNDSSLSVRIGFLATGTATLDDTNSIILNAGGSIASSPSNIFFGRVVCMSTTAGSAVIHFTEESRQ